MYTSKVSHKKTKVFEFDIRGTWTTRRLSSRSECVALVASRSLGTQSPNSEVTTNKLLCLKFKDKIRCNEFD